MYQLLHECIDGEDWGLTTTLSLEQCRARLQGALRTWYVRTGHVDYFNAPILGTTHGDTFQAKVGAYQGVFAASGRLAPVPPGTSINLEITHTIAAWGELGLIALIFVAVLLRALPTPSVGEAIVVLIFTAILLAVPLHWQWEKRRLLNFVRVTLDAAPTSPALYSPSLDW